MSYSIIEIERIDERNYHLFDDMIFYRMNGRDRNVGEINPLFDAERVTTALTNPNLYVYAAKCDNRFVAWISLVYMPKIGRTGGRGYIYVDELWTADEYRRRGIARTLMGKADELCVEFDALGIRLYTSNPVAKSLYESCGYITEDDMAYFMEK